MATEYYLLSIHGVVDVQEMTSTFVMRSDGVTAGDTLTNGTDLIDAWISNALGPWLDIHSEDYQIRRITARRINPSGSAVASMAFQVAEHVGQVTSPASAMQLAPCVRLIPGTLGSTAGKVFLPSPPANQVNNNAYDSGYVANVGTYLDTLIAGISETWEWTLSIHHRKTDTFSACVGYNLSPRFGFQGRRRYPVG